MSKTLPSGWHRYEIGQIAQVGNGTTPSRKEPRYWTDGIYPWLPTAKVNDRIITSADEFISQAALDEWPTKLYPSNSVLVAMIGQGKTRGMIAYLGIDAAINQNFACVVPGRDVDSRYLFYFLENSYNELRLSSHGSNQGALNCSLIEQFPVNVPPLAEQRRIAEILGTWDEAIALTGRLIDALRDRKKGLMQLLLSGEVRFEEFGLPAEHKSLPEGWSTARLDNVFERITRTVSGDVDHVLSISAKIGFQDQREKFSRVIAGRNIEKYIHLYKGEFAYNKGNSDAYPQGCIYRLEEFEEGAVPNVYYCFKVASEYVDADFYKHYFEAGMLNDQLRPLINTGVRNDGLLNLAADRFFSVEIAIPPLAEQERIAELLDTANQEIRLLEQQLKALGDQKRGLMQQLLTGQIRVGV